jgi:hypothetical protein
MKQRIALGKVSDPTGRLDVAAYRIAERALEMMERQYNLAGLREHLLPCVESALVETLPTRNLMNEIPQELQAILHVVMQNRRLL